MGTGSHRPQWEAARGRPDVTGGIKHSRSLKSHTKLKYRDPQKTLNRKLLTHTLERKIPHARDNEEHEKRYSESKLDSIDTDTSTNDRVPSDPLVSGSEDDESDDSDEAELRNELQRLTKRKALRAQKEEADRPKSSWRSEAVFSRKPRPQKKKESFLDKYVR